MHWVDRLKHDSTEADLTEISLTRIINLTVSQSDQGMQCKAKSGEKAEFTFSLSLRDPAF